MFHPESRFFPLRCFRVVLIAAVLLYFVLGALLVAANRQARGFRERILVLDGVVDDLRLQTQAMASLALLTASTGEQIFAVRHGDHLSRAQADVRKLLDLASTADERFRKTPVEALFPGIAAIQRQALALAGQGRGQEAWALLRGIDYETAQQGFQDALNRLDASIESRVEETLSFQTRYTDIAIWCIVFFAPLLIVVSVLLLRTARRHIRSDFKGRIALRESSRTLESLLDATTDRILLADWNGRVLSVNSAGAAGFGVSASEVRGKRFSDLFPESVAASRLDRLRQVMTTAKAARFTDTRGGIVFDNIIAPLPDAAGVPRGAVLFARDVTALTRARERAEAANRAKNVFLATMSHEIRTPLNGIQGMAQVLEGTALTDDQRQCLADIETASEVLLSLVNAVLELSQLEAGQMETVHAPFALESILQSAVTSHARQARDKGLRLTTTITDDVPQLLVGDGERLREVLERLTGNAVKFTETGEVALAVRRDHVLDVAGQEARVADVLFSVRDTGIGIAAKDQARIFETFAQVDGSATRRYGGTGLGLAIVSRLVTALGGTLQVQSQPGQGSVFSFTLRFDLSEE